MREEYGSRRRTSTCNQAKKFFGKKGCETEDKTVAKHPSVQGTWTADLKF